jgi:hypothetical protein
VKAVLKKGSRPEVSRPEVSRPEVSRPEVSRPEVSRPEVSRPEVSRPEVSRPEVSRPEVSRPEVSRPEVSRPEVSRPEVSRPEVSRPRVPGEPMIYKVLRAFVQACIGARMDAPCSVRMGTQTLGFGWSIRACLLPDRQLLLKLEQVELERLAIPLEFVFTQGRGHPDRCTVETIDGREGYRNTKSIPTTAKGPSPVTHGCKGDDRYPSVGRDRNNSWFYLVARASGTVYSDASVDSLTNKAKHLAHGFAPPTGRAAAS